MYIVCVYIHMHAPQIEGYCRDVSARAKADYKIVAMSPNMMSAQAELSVLINHLLSGRGSLLRESCVIPRN